MSDAKINLKIDIPINEGLTLRLDDYFDVSEESLAESLRNLVWRRSGEQDDGGADTYYDVGTGIIFLGEDPTAVLSRDPKLVQFMVTADLLDGRDFTASGNNIDVRAAGGRDD